MQENVIKYIKKYNLLLKGDLCVLAISGGADSTALACVMHKIAAEYSLKLKAVHVNHGIRGEEAQRDADFVKKLCESLDIECEIACADVPAFAFENKLSIEEAARTLRYRLLYETAFKFYKQEHDINEAEALNLNSRVKIAVAHNKEDNAETVLMQLIRGSGLKGLSGIRPKRDIIIRPLLNISRAQIEVYLKEEGREFMLDSTNLSEDYTRNKIRHRIIPELERLNSSALDNINKASEIIADTFDYLDRKVYNIVEEYMLWEESGVRISLDILRAEPHIIRSHIIRLMIEKLKGSLKDIASIHIDSIEALINMQVGKSIDLPYNLKAERSYTDLAIILKPENQKEVFHAASISEQSIPQSGTEKYKSGAYLLYNDSFEFSFLDYRDEMEIPHSDTLKWFDAEVIGDDYEIRYRKKGDFIRLEKVGKKTVKAYMADEKIPAKDRGKIPLLVKGEEVVWIVGKRINERFKVGKNTKKILQVRYIER